ncbi:MAG: 16S rRNA (adenine(1518)-N(6)/adenine(1519)-N(6))-dimethyltransferase RsmA [Treponema sp.]|jgi:16S rRNA (adenine1518-N6/adenine1519-N6)-dimethyltransferase|nr:16S rRNA (adenine(1518)-N(6)/adenine(1519)-N(6))-dimethyltransferase RsmA [Treponema sp.]
MEINYDSPRALKVFLEERGLGMRKKFGQNFLINPAVRKKLIDALGPEKGEEVWEIGSGLGVMTRDLLERGCRVKAFEIDRGFIGVLRELFGGEGSFLLAEGDVLKTWRQEAGADYLIGNLPYNIAAVLLADMIEGGRFFKRMVVTVQREVARRMAAKPGSADYSSFSVLVGSVYRADPLMVIGGGSFYPPPRVDSQGVLLELLPPEERTGSPLFYPLVRQLFSSRRKTVKNNLQGFVSARIAGGDDVRALSSAALEKCGIRPEERAENLSVARFGELALVLGEDYGLC